jgi:high-affinity iron transporter
MVLGELGPGPQSATDQAHRLRQIISPFIAFRGADCQGYAATVEKLVSVVALGVLLATMAASRPARAADAQDSLVPQQVVHLLDYVAADYAGAVSGGQVTNPTELAEQVEVLAEAARLAAKLRAPANAPDFRARVLAARELVERHRPEVEVTTAIKALRTELTAYFDVAPSPAELPSRERGKQLFEMHCTTCHGADGRADTPRAAELTPRPANLLAPEVARLLSPARVFATTRFGVPKTAMVPFDFLSDSERWDVAFYASGLDHAKRSGPPERKARIFALGELADESDDVLRADLKTAGIAEADIEDALADLRTAAPYDAETLRPSGTPQFLVRARASLKKVHLALVRGDRDQARTRLLSVYLDDIEPIEAELREADLSLTRDMELQFREIRGDIDRGVTEPEVSRKLDALGALIGRAEPAVTGGQPSFSRAVFVSAMLALREGVEAALLIAALLAVVARTGHPERKRWVHAGWGSAAGAGAITWFAARHFVQMSGLGRETLEGVAALLAAAVLFYVSYWLFAKREAARWMNYLRAKAGSGQAAFSLFGISFLAVYREAFETILFYQPIMARPGAATAAGLGAIIGAALLIALVIAYGRAGRFAPPRSFFAFSTVLLYGLAVVFTGQGIAALQTTGHLPLHPVALPHVAALGIYPTLETYAAQALLVALAVAAGVLTRYRTPPAPPGPAGGNMAGTREGVKF